MYIMYRHNLLNRHTSIKVVLGGVNCKLQTVCYKKRQCRVFYIAVRLEGQAIGRLGMLLSWVERIDTGFVLEPNDRARDNKTRPLSVDPLSSSSATAESSEMGAVKDGLRNDGKCSEARRRILRTPVPIDAAGAAAESLTGGELLGMLPSTSETAFVTLLLSSSLSSSSSSSSSSSISIRSGSGLPARPSRGPGGADLAPRVSGGGL